MTFKDLTKTVLRRLISGEESGYIRLPRHLMEGLFSEDSQIRRFHRLYVSLITHAAFVDTVVNYRNGKVHLKEGELLLTLRDYSSLTDNSHMQVSRGIKWLEEEGLIKKYNLGGGQLISIQHYRAITRGVFKPTNKSASTTTTSASTALPENDDPGVLQRLREEFSGKM